MVKKNLLISTTIFVAGAVTMIYEIAGARVLGPYLGTSVFVWTSLIGIIMGSLSLGYWLGGRLSIRNSDRKWIAVILILAALCVLFTAIANSYLLERLGKYLPDIRWRTVVAALILFAPASVLLGMILPYGVRLVILRLDQSGRTVGNLYALSTIGSIAGTFAAGFWLIPQLGFLNVIYMMALFLVIFALLYLLLDKHFGLSIIPLIVMVVTGFLWTGEIRKDLHYLDVDTAYNRVLIYESTDKSTGRPVKILKVNNETSSAMFTDNDNGLVFEVLKYYHLVDHFVPEFENCLMIGGSGYAFPKDYLKMYPEANIDVVEIDPGLTVLAKAHFDLKESSRLRIIHEDGRTFLNRNEKKYDAIFMDAYKSILTIPFQLTTQEAVKHIYESLHNEGIVIANIISALEPGKMKFLLAETATYRSIFPHVLLFAVQYPDPDETEQSYFQNIILVGLKSADKPRLQSQDTVLNSFLKHRISIDIPENTILLTDEYAPVEFMSSKNIE